MCLTHLLIRDSSSIYIHMMPCIKSRAHAQGFASPAYRAQPQWKYKKKINSAKWISEHNLKINTRSHHHHAQALTVAASLLTYVSW